MRDVNTSLRLAEKHSGEHPYPWDDHVDGWVIRDFGNGNRVWVVPFTFTYAIIVGPPNEFWYSDRWCYLTAEAAIAAAVAWDDEDQEPVGWHRHPSSGRRRENGDPATEYTSM